MFGLYQAGRAQEAQPVADRALRVLKESGLSRSLIHAQTLNVTAFVARACSHFDEAELTYAEALSLATTLGDESQAMMIRLNMAELEFEKANAAGALELVKEAEAKSPGVRTDLTRILALQNGAAYRIALGDIPGARSAARDTLRLARGARLLQASTAMQHLATVAALSGDARCGARLRVRSPSRCPRPDVAGRYRSDTAAR